ncbi:hypothetical protein BSKO_09231 [Bryopsis sp. KO-2023]|nr:hypothetical protein BSKO_09231 [Bryopsis sp. KO-2023]
MLRSLLIAGASILAVSGVKRFARFVVTQVANRDLRNNMHLLNNSTQLPRRFIAWLPRFLSVETSPGLRDKGTFLFLGGEARNESQCQFQKKPSQVGLRNPLPDIIKTMQDASYNIHAGFAERGGFRFASPVVPNNIVGVLSRSKPMSEADRGSHENFWPP